jgi:predicted nucleic acid-binding protein
MSVFVDTGVFYAHHDIDASRHDVGAAALRTVLQSAAYGHVLTSAYVYDEAVTLTYRRTNRMDDAVELGRRLRGEDPYPNAIDILHSSPALFERATEAFETYADQNLSFTDVMTVVLVEHHSVDAVLSFDDDFDGLVDRLDPATVVSQD